jgi:hypothetical protein
MEDEARKRKQRLTELRLNVKQEQVQQNEENQEINRKRKTVEEEADEIVEQVKDVDIIPEEVDIAALVPKKVDWDLKRNIESKMEKLDKMTNNKINELIRMRIRQNEGKGMADAVVNADSDQE